MSFGYIRLSLNNELIIFRDYRLLLSQTVVDFKNYISEMRTCVSYQLISHYFLRTDPVMRNIGFGDSVQDVMSAIGNIS